MPAWRARRHHTWARQEHAPHRFHGASSIFHGAADSQDTASRTGQARVARLIVAAMSGYGTAGASLRGPAKTTRATPGEGASGRLACQAYFQHWHLTHPRSVQRRPSKQQCTSGAGMHMGTLARGAPRVCTCRRCASHACNRRRHNTKSRPRHGPQCLRCGCPRPAESEETLAPAHADCRTRRGAVMRPVRERGAGVVNAHTARAARSAPGASAPLASHGPEGTGDPGHQRDTNDRTSEGKSNAIREGKRSVSPIQAKPHRTRQLRKHAGARSTACTKAACPKWISLSA